MIKFFRTIRQKMLSKNKFSNYLLYAIGEIILVVIGILIALSINNRNDYGKESIKKNNLLKALEIEFTKNLSQLDTILKYDNEVVESSLEFLKLKPNDSILNDEIYMGYLMQKTSWVWTFDPQNGALRSGISSGEINYIENKKLTNMLFGWADVVSDAKENEEIAYNTRMVSQPVIEKYVRNVNFRNSVRKELGDSKFNSDYKGLVLDPLFEDYISNRYTRMREAMNELNDVRDLNVRILKKIDEELNNNQ